MEVQHERPSRAQHEPRQHNRERQQHEKVVIHKPLFWQRLSPQTRDALSLAGVVFLGLFAMEHVLRNYAPHATRPSRWLEFGADLVHDFFWGIGYLLAESSNVFNVLHFFYAVSSSMLWHGYQGVKFLLPIKSLWYTLEDILSPFQKMIIAPFGFLSGYGSAIATMPSPVLTMIFSFGMLGLGAGFFLKFVENYRVRSEKGKKHSEPRSSRGL